jgi:hypothetical protein
MLGEGIGEHVNALRQRLQLRPHRSILGGATQVPSAVPPAIALSISVAFLSRHTGAVAENLVCGTADIPNLAYKFQPDNSGYQVEWRGNTWLQYLIAVETGVWRSRRRRRRSTSASERGFEGATEPMLALMILRASSGACCSALAGCGEMLSQ